MNGLTLQELEADRDKAIRQIQQMQRNAIMLEGLIAYLNENIRRLSEVCEKEKP